MIKRASLETALLSKGFSHDANKSPDHVWYRLYDGAKATAVMTKLSHGSGYKDLGDNLVSAISKQMGLTKPELKRYVDCTLSGADYLTLMRAREKI